MSDDPIRRSRGAIGAFAVIFALAVSLGGCGVRGPLKLPQPPAPTAAPPAPTDDAAPTPAAPPTERKP